MRTSLRFGHEDICQTGPFGEGKKFWWGSGPSKLKLITPPKIYMEPENTPLEKENHLPNHHFHSFSASMLIFGGVGDFDLPSGKLKEFKEYHHS